MLSLERVFLIYVDPYNKESASLGIPSRSRDIFTLTVHLFLDHSIIVILFVVFEVLYCSFFEILKILKILWLS